jgi:hypothetical protein
MGTQAARHEARGRGTIGDVSEYIVNPRRAARAPSRCAALVHAPGSDWNAETEDISPLGCQLVAPGAVGRGLKLNLVFANPRVQGSLQVEGKVAWGSSQPPWRIGVAFDGANRAQAERWIGLLVAAHPGLAGVRRVPDRLPLDAMLFLAAPPFLVDFTPEEVEVLRHVGGGTTIAALRTRLAASWNPALRATFSLLARGVVTVSGGAAAHPSTWKKVMADLNADFVAEVPPLARPVTFIERTAARRPPRLDEPLNMDLDPRFTPPPELAQLPPVASVARPAPGTPLPQPLGGPTHSSAGTGWRGQLRNRSPAAQECFDLGRTELSAGRNQSAMAHLRRALQLAPGDAEIAAEIGRALSSA